MVARGERKEIGEGDYEVQTSSSIINEYTLCCIL